MPFFRSCILLGRTDQHAEISPGGFTFHYLYGSSAASPSEKAGWTGTILLAKRERLGYNHLMALRRNPEC